MESRRCVRQSRDANEAIPEPPKGDGHPGPRLTVSPAPTRRSKHGDQGQENEEEHGKEAGSKDAEREAAGQEGQEVAGPGRAARSAGNRVGCPVHLSRALLRNRAELAGWLSPSPNRNSIASCQASGDIPARWPRRLYPDLGVST